MASPMIPGINDAEMEKSSKPAPAGATSASYVLLRLPHELRELFADWLKPTCRTAPDMC